MRAVTRDSLGLRVAREAAQRVGTHRVRTAHGRRARAARRAQRA